MSLAALGLLLTLAGADAPEADAKKLFTAAATAYRRGDYETAIFALRAAYELAPKEQVVFSLAQAYRLQFSADRDPRKLERAVELYREYLARFAKGKRRRHATQHERSLSAQLTTLKKLRPEAFVAVPERSPASFVFTCSIEGAKVTIGDEEITDFPDTFEVEPGPHRLELEAPGYVSKQIETTVPAGATVPLDVVLEPLPALLTVSAPDGAEVIVDGAPIGEAPLLRKVRMNAGRHLVAVVKNGHYAYAEEVEVTRGETGSVVADLETTDQRVVSYVFMGTGAALIGGSLLAALAAAGHQSNARLLEDRLATRGLTAEEVRRHTDLVNRRDDAVVVAATLGVSAAISGALAVFLYALDTPRAPTASITTDVSLEPTAGGASASIRARF